MKVRNLFTLFAVAGLLLSYAAQTSRAAAPEEVATLRMAYRHLHAADHDYKGHRMKAMHAIEAACKALGVKVDGDGKGEEPQAESDSHLKAAQELLASINPAKTGRRTKAAAHIEHAISELSEALAVK